MTESTDQVLRLDAKLATLARNGRTAMACFILRGQDEDLAALKSAEGSDLLLGVYIAHDGSSSDGRDPDQ